MSVRQLIVITASLLVGPVLAVACSSAPPDDPAALPTDRAAHVAPDDWVTVKDGKMSIDQFTRCDFGEGDHASSLQLLVHAEADASEISRDRFVARAAVAFQGQYEQLAAGSWAEQARAGGAAGDPGHVTPVCREVDAPEGDVDYEVSVVVHASDVEAEVVDVAARDMNREVANQTSSGACVRSTMGATYCSRSSGGTAVRDNLGQALCARGQCVRSAMGSWRCSRAAGGWAELDMRGGPTCQNGCYSPTTTECRRQ